MKNLQLILNQMEKNFETITVSRVAKCVDVGIQAFSMAWDAGMPVTFEQLLELNIARAGSQARSASRSASLARDRVHVA